MNRRKKIIKKLLKKAKQAQAKKQPKRKNTYISKAEREKEQNTDTSHSPEITEPTIKNL